MQKKNKKQPPPNVQWSYFETNSSLTSSKSLNVLNSILPYYIVCLDGRYSETVGTVLFLHVVG